MPSGHTFTHTHTHRYSGVMAGADTHLDLVTVLGGGAEFHMHACVSVCVSGVRGEYRAGALPALEAVFIFKYMYIFFPPFISEDSWRGPRTSGKIKAGHSRDRMLTDSPKCIELNLD